MPKAAAMPALLPPATTIRVATAVSIPGVKDISVDDTTNVL